MFYAVHATPSGEPLDASTTSYVVRLDPPPPVDGHWSLTLYPTATGLLYPNEIDRYAIAATTPALEYDADGSLTVVIEHERPANAANWLPAPPGGSISICVRGGRAPRSIGASGGLARSRRWR